MIIGILEDIELQATAVAQWVTKAGHHAEVCHDGDSFIDLVRRQRIDLLMLDWDVPGKSGIEVLKWVRASFADVMPVIMVTQHDSEVDIVHGLNSGADDYVIKPLRERELMARVQAQLRKYYPQEQASQVIRVGMFAIDIGARTVSVGGEAVELAQREFDLATMLFSNAGRIVTKDVLMKKIWGSVDRKYDATLATYVSKLRSQLGLRAKNGMVISTIYNYGYRLEFA
ncbi:MULTISPECIES: response regulator transcription factor [unclassified Herbaspirillum]|uniref:response regulator transcription factor n=1 Tax=unclassified Herbaspirillum TaxID=2624150 RepID=UPI00114D7B8E|nr:MULTISPECIES: response regulator transcription factor [unclassified Herbaspirillum]MBB5390560.1 DNA-binding response OmpR family regulator [Herbaspirillum sp. SJZ102]